jgi:hypothetical protein
MGISTECSLMVGLPYDEFVSALPEGENSFEEFEELIDNGGLDIGSIYYDSNRNENIVGKFLTQPSSLREITLEKIDESIELSNELKKQFPNIEFKLYLTNIVW